MTDPKPRKDRKCYVCLKEVPIIAWLEQDAFCSAPCCREYYGLSNSPSPAAKL